VFRIRYSAFKIKGIMNVEYGMMNHEMKCTSGFRVQNSIFSLQNKRNKYKYKEIIINIKK